MTLTRTVQPTHQTVDDLQPRSGLEPQRRDARARDQLAVLRSRLERTDDRRSARDHAATARASCLDRRHRTARNLVALGQWQRAIERVIAGRARMTGVPHTPGTREYLTCERGTVELAVAGESYTLAEGDVVTFRGDQRHSYHSPGKVTAVAYSVIAFAPMAT